jgi:hypothetical protein
MTEGEPRFVATAKSYETAERNCATIVENSTETEWS